MSGLKDNEARISCMSVFAIVHSSLSVMTSLWLKELALEFKVPARWVPVRLMSRSDASLNTREVILYRTQSWDPNLVMQLTAVTLSQKQRTFSPFRN